MAHRASDPARRMTQPPGRGPGYARQAMREYYHARAAEYDDWWLGKGLFAERPRPGWFEEVVKLAGVLAAS